MESLKNISLIQNEAREEEKKRKESRSSKQKTDIKAVGLNTTLHDTLKVSVLGTPIKR